MSTTRPAEVNSGVTTSWIPFTTPGASVPSAACSSEIYRVPGSQDIMAFDPYYAENIQSGLQCLPAEVTQSWAQSSKEGTRTSLGGFQCPSLYTRAATASVDKISTIVACCPSFYGYRSDSKCISTVPAGQNIVIKSLSGALAARQGSSTGDGGISVTGFLVTGYSFADDPIPVTKTVDPSSSSASLGTLSTSSASAVIIKTQPGNAPISTAPKPTSTPSTTSSANSNAPTSSTTSHGLTVGAKVGITVGVVFLVIALAIAGACLHTRRRRRKELGASPNIDENGIREISREPRQYKNKQRTEYPDMDGLQTVISSEALAQRERETAALRAGKARETVNFHVGDKVIIPGMPKTPTGPFLELPAGEVNAKYEMSAAEVQNPTRKSIQQTQQQKTHPITRNRAESNVSLRRDYTASPVSRNTTPEPLRGHGRTNSITPVSRDPSLGRRTPDLISRHNVRNGSVTPGMGRDPRLDVPGGAISPMSTERSFLDLSDDDR